MQVVPARASPHLQHPHRCSGLMLANHTAVRHTLDKTVSQFDTLFQRKVTLRRGSCTSDWPWLCAVPCTAVLWCIARASKTRCCGRSANSMQKQG